MTVPPPCATPRPACRKHHQLADGRDRRRHGRVCAQLRRLHRRAQASCRRACLSTLLNGASGIAVGLATEIPSHNLREVADACVALIKNPKPGRRRSHSPASLPGPDYPGGGQIISQRRQRLRPPTAPAAAALKVRARWKIEDLARGQWQLVVNELPPGVSTQRVLEEIEETHQPQGQGSEKKPSRQDQVQLKANILHGRARRACATSRAKTRAVRLVFEPKTSRIEQQRTHQHACWRTPAWKVPRRRST